MKKVGVILARFQPIHHGHMELIRKAVSENDEVVILIGSADKINQRNPIPYSIREELVTECLEKYIDAKDTFLRVLKLDDLTDESDNSHDWGFYLYSKIVRVIQQPNFTIYYSDGYEIITSWFPSFILRDNISLSLLARGSVHEGVSATEVRNAILHYDDDNLLNLVPKNVYDNRDMLRAYIKAWH